MDTTDYSAGQYGVDVGARRADDLDRELLTQVSAAVANGTQPSVADIGCGSGGLAFRLASAGAVVTAVDIVDYHTAIAERNTSLLATRQEILFVHDSAQAMLKRDSVIYDYLVLQRVMHYLPYAEAVELLTAARDRSSQLYLSVTGVESAIGHQHPLREAALCKRFTHLPATAQTTFSLSAPLCVYTQVEFRDVLVTSGWCVERLWTSAFGNHKAIATSASTRNGFTAGSPVRITHPLTPTL